MNRPIYEQSVIVGVDAHKYSHAAAAVDAWGQEKGRLNFTNDSLADCLSWLKTLGRREDVIVAVEDANSYGCHLVSALAGQQFAIRSVPAVLTERDRQHSAQRDKSDFRDAKRVAKVILSKYEETLPVIASLATSAELAAATELNLLLNERRDVVKQGTAIKNQLHSLLHQYYGDHYADGFSKAFNKQAMIFYQVNLVQAIFADSPNANQAGKALIAESILRRIRRLKLLQEQSAAILKQVTKIGETSKPVVALHESIHGCGLLTAGAIMAELVTIRRFGGRDKLAKYAGIAPTLKSSGAHHRLYTNPFGNRLLNKALHTIALSQIAVKGDDRGKRYYRKKLKEGKTKLWALRCLKRRLINLVFQTLKRAEAGIKIGSAEKIIS
jgi:transposase